MHRNHYASLAFVLAILSPLLAMTCLGQTTRPTNFRSVRLDDAGVIRWTDDDSEVALFGANYCLPSACDYRAAGYVSADRKELIDIDMAHFARLGFDGMRVCFWGDYENSDKDGNLVANDHLDLMDYLIARARERGISILLTPITTYSSQWPDNMQVKGIGFSEHFEKRVLGTDPAAIAAQVNYIKQLLNHVNPYTGVAIKEEPSIIFIEMINEPWQHPEDEAGSVKYLDALVGAVRSTGCQKLTFHNLSQDFAMAASIAKSTVQGVTFAWYPTGLVSGHTLRGNYLPYVDSYPEMLASEVKGKPRIVYEFDSPDLENGYMLPAMTRTFRSVGAQFAAMFSYDMVATAPYNLGWQTHRLNLIYTAAKAMSAAIAVEVMHRLPRYSKSGSYPQNMKFGDFRVDGERDLGELVADDAFMYANDTTSAPLVPEKLQRIAGHGSSPIVKYDGTGCYFIDKLSDGLWRLEIYPDAVNVADPFGPMSPDRVVTRAISRKRSMTIALGDLGSAFHLHSVSENSRTLTQASSGTVSVEPGVYLLSTKPTVDRANLVSDFARQAPPALRHLALSEFHVPTPPKAPPSVQILSPSVFPNDRPVTIVARVVQDSVPDKVTVSIRSSVTNWLKPFPMKSVGGFDYASRVSAAELGEGPIDFCITTESGENIRTYPLGVAKQAWAWDLAATPRYHAAVVAPDAAIGLFAAGEDLARMSFTRTGARPAKLVTGKIGGESALRIESPSVKKPYLDGWYAVAFVGDHIRSRISEGRTLQATAALAVSARAFRGQLPLSVALVETDGTAWKADFEVKSSWAEVSVPLAAFRRGRAALLPQAFPNLSAYWMEGPTERKPSGMDVSKIERVQFSVPLVPGAPSAEESTTIDVASVVLRLN